MKSITERRIIINTFIVGDQRFAIDIVIGPNYNRIQPGQWTLLSSMSDSN